MRTFIIWLQLILFVIGSIAMSGCGVFKKTQNYPPYVIERNNYKEVYTDTTIFLPGESVSTSLDSNTVVKIMNYLELYRSDGVNDNHDTLSFKSYNNGVEMKLYLDALGALKIDCDKSASQYNALIKLIETQNSKEIKTFDYEKIIQKIRQGMLLNIAVLLLFILIYFIIIQPKYRQSND